MAEPIDSAVMLEDATEIVQEQYMDRYDEQYQSRFGSTTNKCFTPDPEPVVGDGKNMQYEVGPADSVRFSIDPLGESPAPQRIDAGKIKVRWNRTNLAAHDFNAVKAQVRFDIFTIENGKSGTIVDLADRIYDSVQGDFNEKLAIMRHCDRTGQLTLVNGTPRQADSNVYSSCTASATNTTGMRIQIDTGSIATIRPNARYDFYRAGVLIAGNIKCSGIPNFGDVSASFSYVTSGLPGEISTGNLASVADNDVIVYSGMYNMGMWSFGAAFATPTSTAYQCGVNRLTPEYQWMIPQNIAAGSTKLTKTHFNNLGIAMGFIGEDQQNSVVTLTGPRQHQAMRDELGEEAFIQWPTDSANAKRFMNFGSVGLNYQHPTFGAIKILADPLAREDRVLFLVNETWKTLSYQWKGLRAINRGAGHWYFLNQATPNSGQSLIKAADWAGNIADFCTRPWKNGAITGLLAPT